MIFTFPLPLPSLKNSKRAFFIPTSKINKRGRQKYRAVILPSQNYQDYKENIMDYLAKIKKAEVTDPIDSPCVIVYKFFLPNYRRLDYTNKMQSVEELLVDSGIIKDDNCKILNEIVVLPFQIDKINPRIEVSLIVKSQ